MAVEPLRGQSFLVRHAGLLLSTAGLLLATGTGIVVIGALNAPGRRLEALGQTYGVGVVVGPRAFAPEWMRLFVGPDTNVYIESPHVPPEMTATLAKMRHVELLFLEGTQIDGHLVDSIPSLLQLKDLSFYDCDFTPIAADERRDCNVHLENLRVARRSAARRSGSLLPPQSLGLARCARHVYLTNIESSEIAQMANVCPAAESLDLYGTWTDDVAGALPKWTAVRRLWLFIVPHSIPLESPSVRLVGIPALGEIDFAQFPSSGYDELHITDNPRLNSIRLCAYGGASIVIADNPVLESISISAAANPVLLRRLPNLRTAKLQSVDLSQLVDDADDPTMKLDTLQLESCDVDVNIAQRIGVLRPKHIEIRRSQVSEAAKAILDALFSDGTVASLDVL